jgi:hypothetical protein
MALVDEFSNKHKMHDAELPRPRHVEVATALLEAAVATALLQAAVATALYMPMT